MSILVADNTLYRGKKPLDARLVFSTIALMIAYPETSLYNGIIVFNEEDRKFYTYDENNSIDLNFKKWRAFNEKTTIREEEFSITLGTYTTNPVELNVINSIAAGTAFTVRWTVPTSLQVAADGSSNYGVKIVNSKNPTEVYFVGNTWVWHGTSYADITYSIPSEITSPQYYTVYIYDVNTNEVYVTKDFSIIYKGKIYAGVVDDAGAAITALNAGNTLASQISSLTFEEVNSNTESIDVNLQLENQHFIILKPKSFGTVKSILDKHENDYLVSSVTRSSVEADFEGLGVNVTYYAYYLTDKATIDTLWLNIS